MLFKSIVILLLRLLWDSGVTGRKGWALAANSILSHSLACFNIVSLCIVLLEELCFNKGL